MASSENNGAVDKTLFAGTVATIFLLAIPTIFARKQVAGIIEQAFGAITHNVGFAYLWCGLAVFILLMVLAFGRFGKVRLGTPDSRPEFSTVSWAAMLFCAGIGAGMLYWAVIEWGYYIDAPPYGYEPRSPEAIEWAAAYGLYHWGLLAWAFFCLPTLAIGYAFYVRKVPHLRLSTACIPYLGGDDSGPRARLIDFLFMLSMVGGAGTALALSTPMIAASLAQLTGLPHDFLMEGFVVALCFVLFGTSAYMGLDKGIKRLSDLNMALALLLLLFVLLVGPTLFILKMGTNGIGLVLQNFIRMSTWTDPVRETGFVENWTVFYWAWWVSYGPFAGIFTARISEGRTIREVIFGMLVYGSMGVGLFFIVFGNYALHLELNDILPVTTIMKEHSEAAAITQVFLSLPWGEFALLAFFVVSLIFVATTYDSASFTLASVSTRELRARDNPARWHRLFWAFALSILPLALMFMDGGLQVVLSITMIVSLPLLVVNVMMCFSLVKMLREDHPYT